MWSKFVSICLVLQVTRNQCDSVASMTIVFHVSFFCPSVWVPMSTAAFSVFNQTVLTLWQLKGGVWEWCGVFAPYMWDFLEIPTCWHVENVLSPMMMEFWRHAFRALVAFKCGFSAHMGSQCIVTTSKCIRWGLVLVHYNYANGEKHLIQCCWLTCINRNVNLILKIAYHFNFILTSSTWGLQDWSKLQNFPRDVVKHEFNLQIYNTVAWMIWGMFWHTWCGVSLV